MQVPQKLSVPGVWDTQVWDFLPEAGNSFGGYKTELFLLQRKTGENGTKYNKKGEILANVRFASFLAALQSSQRKSWWVWEEDEWQPGLVDGQKLGTAAQSRKMYILWSFMILQGGNKTIPSCYILAKGGGKSWVRDNSSFYSLGLCSLSLQTITETMIPLDTPRLRDVRENWSCGAPRQPGWTCSTVINLNWKQIADKK